MMSNSLAYLGYFIVKLATVFIYYFLHIHLVLFNYLSTYLMKSENKSHGYTTNKL